MIDQNVIPQSHIDVKTGVLEIILNVAKNLSIPSTVKELSSSQENVIDINGAKLIPWSDTSLSHGYPGLCILFGELDHMFPEDGWDVIGHSFMVEIQKSIEEYGIHSTSTFSGLAGIGFAARSLSRSGSRYQKFISSINHLLIEHTKVRLEQIKNTSTLGTIMSDYDVIEGLSGVGRYLLLYKDNVEAKNVLQDILQYMIDITKDIRVNDQHVPGWFVASKNLFLETEQMANPIGNFNCGLSHGIPGPMALLAVSIIEGVEIAGQKEAIAKVGEWLIRNIIESENGFYFPGTITWEDQIKGIITPSVSRDAWCYGSPGVSRSLYLAGKALKNDSFIKVAEYSLKSVFERPTEQWGLHSPTFCHGFSGLLHITNLTNASLQSKTLNVHTRKLVSNILSLYDKELPFGFQDLEPSDLGMKAMNKAGFLDGTTTILLTLLAYYNNKNYTEWDTLFLLN
ncbi:lanthionine synthetase C family protein [Bacillus tropicus]|uniref:lanthionine synthetase C family protein n=1 Tax=Bacillus TaxID=1386 RepID=UPI000A840AE7|nr:MULTISPECIES: lanthionine synthetase C family protein [Bacillus]MCC1485873.1 lanthionine synthetase C family protein [Bacillus tropicus]MDA1552548.1 lanthionine synthetase C family protein [Bacillus cereus group sp. TH243-3LC]MDA1657364.1 lanthionine synthetase C family protein [Bacillus cereus group sp. TH150LC]MDA1860414.1 lanthionine synthetase C family protein [Bacillus cereus group sp. BY122LC]MEC2553414.1 lanthionine synthetase C family protein [Bacillus tropicus]